MRFQPLPDTKALNPDYDKALSTLLRV
jgi:hypothetical protein